MSETILKGKINYYTYIWHTEKGACEKCQALDGLNFKNTDEIPDKPHPNCRCWIEVSEENDNKDDLCDCWKFYDEIEEMIGEANSLREEVSESIDMMFAQLQKIFTKSTKAELENCVDSLRQIFGAISDFIRNYNDMKKANTKGADKYFHSKANCQASQRGELGAIVAKGISDLRELSDSYKNVYIKGMSAAESVKDSAEDQQANEYGRKQGIENPYNYCRDLVEIYRPNGLPDKY